MTSVAFSKQQMIEQQLRAWEVFDPRVLCAFDELRREDFVPARFRNLAFADMAIPLGRGETMMAPKVEGRMLQALGLQPTDRTLEVGTGSGWITALLASMTAEVLTVDIVPEFTAAARQKVEAAGFQNVTLETRDAAALQGEGAYDCIAVTGSMPLYDDRFERMLRPGGRLFVITGEAPVMEARLVTRGTNDGYLVERLFETDIPALHHFPRPSRFAL